MDLKLLVQACTDEEKHQLRQLIDEHFLRKPLTGTPTKQFTTAEVRDIAVRADADPRTVWRVIRGQPVKGMPERRIRAVLQQCRW